MILLDQNEMKIFVEVLTSNNPAKYQFKQHNGFK